MKDQNYVYVIDSDEEPDEYANSTNVRVDETFEDAAADDDNVSVKIERDEEEAVDQDEEGEGGGGETENDDQEEDNSPFVPLKPKFVMVSNKGKEEADSEEELQKEQQQEDENRIEEEQDHGDVEDQIDGDIGEYETHIEYETWMENNCQTTTMTTKSSQRSIGDCLSLIVRSVIDSSFMVWQGHF